MNILHVISSVYKAGGGTSEVVPRLCRALQECGHPVTLIVIEAGEISDVAHDAIAAGVELVQFPIWPHFKMLGISPEMRRGLKDLVAQADIVHLHGLWQAPCWYAAAECLRQRKPYVMMPHGFLEPERLKISKWKKRIIGSLFDRRYLTKANALVATAESEADGFRQYGLTNPVHIMPIGLDLEKFDFSHGERGEHGEKKRLLYFSRITPIKGLDMLVQAWKRLQPNHPDWELIITGPDDRGYTRELQSYITSLGLIYKDETSAVNLNLQPQPSITFTGPVYGEGKYTALRSAAAFVLPTRSENWSIAVAEAMASGLPVVCTKGAPWSCLNDCNAGHWVDISTSAIEQGLRSILSLPDSERRAMGERGRAWVAANLSWPAIANDMIHFYESIVHSQPQPSTSTQSTPTPTTYTSSDRSSTSTHNFD